MDNQDSEKASRITHFRNLMAIVYADGDPHWMEKPFIQCMVEKWGVSSEEIKEVMNDPCAIPFNLPDCNSARAVQLIELAMAVVIDGEIVESEKTLYNNLGGKLQYSSEIIDSVLELADLARDEKMNINGVAQMWIMESMMRKHGLNWCESRI